MASSKAITCLKFPFESSRLVRSFEESQTLLLAARAKALAAEGRSIINFGAGEPDFNTPAPIIERAFLEAKKGQTKYTAVAGMPRLRKAIAKRFSEDYGILFEENEVLASSGGKQAIYHFLQTVIEPGDEVLILSPYWVSFPEMVKMVGGRPVIVSAKGERILASEIREKLSPKTKVLIINSPSNPSGTVYSENELRSYIEVIAQSPIWILSDDTYYKLVYPPARFVSVLQVAPDLRTRTCIIGSASKSYAMTGWRLGWALAPKDLIAAMTKLQSQVTSSPATPPQIATEEAVLNGSDAAEDFRKTFLGRRDLMLKTLEGIPGLRCMKPDGAFYIFANIREALKKDDVVEFSKSLLEDRGVCVIPGIAFGDPNSIRLSYALSEDSILEGLKRLKEALHLRL